MTFLSLVVIVATLATIATLVLGISSMVCDHEIARFDSEHWMASRVLLRRPSCGRWWRLSSLAPEPRFPCATSASTLSKSRRWTPCLVRQRDL
jgi:hypothetical protein